MIFAGLPLQGLFFAGHYPHYDAIAIDHASMKHMSGRLAGVPFSENALGIGFSYHIRTCSNAIRIQRHKYLIETVLIWRLKLAPEGPDPGIAGDSPGEAAIFGLVALEGID